MDPFASEDHTLRVALNDGFGNFTLSVIGTTASTWGGADAFIQTSLGAPVRP